MRYSPTLNRRTSSVHRKCSHSKVHGRSRPLERIYRRIGSSIIGSSVVPMKSSFRAPTSIGRSSSRRAPTQMSTLHPQNTVIEKRARHQSRQRSERKRSRRLARERHLHHQVSRIGNWGKSRNAAVESVALVRTDILVVSENKLQ